MYTAVAIITVNGRTLSRSDVTTQTIADVIAIAGENHIQILDSSTNSQMTVSLSRYVQSYSKVDMSTPITTFVSTMSDLVRNSIASNVPYLNTQGIYPNLIRTYDPLGAQDISVSWTSVNNPEDLDNVQKLSSYNDLLLTPSGTRDLTNTLVCVNGVIHPTVLWNGSLFVVDGLYTMRNSQRKDMTCINTTLVGGHTTIPLTSSNVTGTQINALKVTLPQGQSFIGTTAFIVIDGYLYYPDEILTIETETTAILHGNRIPFIAQYRHNPKTKYNEDTFGDNWNWGVPKTDPQITTSPVPMTSIPSAANDPYVNLFLNTRAVPTATLQSFAFQYARVTSAHSFIVLINTSSLYMQKTPLFPITRVGTYGYASSTGPDGLLRYGVGLCPSYIKLSSQYGQTWYTVAPQDHDIDRIEKTANPDVIPCLVDDYDETYKRPCTLYSFFS